MLIRRSPTGLVISLSCALLACASLGSVARGTEVNEWRLTSRVEGDGVGLASNTFTNIANPFTENHSVNAQNSVATTSYSATWDARGFFQMTVFGHHTAAGNNNLFSRSTGVVHFTPQIDSVLTFTGSYLYSFPGGDRVAHIATVVVD